MLVHIDGLRHETSGLCEKTNSIYIDFTSCTTATSNWSEGVGAFLPHTHRSFCVFNVYLDLRVIELCLIWTSLCMLFEVDPIDLHYMTDRQQRFDLKLSKLKILWKQRHLSTLFCARSISHDSLRFQLTKRSSCWSNASTLVQTTHLYTMTYYIEQWSRH